MVESKSKLAKTGRDYAEVASEWFWEMGPDLRFIYISENVERLVGVPAAFHIGKTREELAGSNSASKKWQQHLQDLRDHKPFKDFRYNRRGPSGQTQFISVSGKPIFDEKGCFQGYIGVGSDLTVQVVAEERAQLANQRLATAIEALSEPFALWDSEDRLLICNQRFRDMNKEIADQAVPGVLYKDFAQALLDHELVPEAKHREKQWLVKRLANHRNPQGSFEQLRQDGLWFMINEQQLPDGSIATISADITDLKIAETKLIENRERIRDFAESASDWFWEMDENLRYCYFSERFTSVTGVPQDNMLGVSQEENGNPGAATGAWEKQLSDLRDHKPFKDFIHPGTKPDGSQVWLSISGKPVYDKGVFKGYRGFGRDITERIDHEKTIERLLHAIQQVPVGIALFDDEDRLIFFNSQYKSIMGIMADILEVGETFENMLRTMVARQPVKDALGREDAYIKERLAKHLAPGPPVEIHRIDRELLALETRAPDGYTFNIITDITEQKRTENDLNEARMNAEKANKVKSEFLASMSHELRTPLNAILGFSEILSGQYFGPTGTAKYKEYADDIHHSGQLLLELVNDLLDISVIEAGKMSLDKTTVSVQEIIEECRRTIKEKAIAKDIQITVTLSDPLSPLYVDKRAVKQVLLNLLSNAVKFTADSGEIKIFAESTEGKTRITVKDNGRGIPSQELSKITNPFTRSVRDPHLAEQGWGLGLAISKSLVELHEGELFIESEIGIGTSVTIVLSSQ